MPEHLLSGCLPEPLGSYLGALGVLRLVAEQADAAATGHWSPEGFVLRCALDRAELTRFFVEDYRPSPITNPWNGAGGFYRREHKATKQRTVATTATKTLDLVEMSEAPRLERLRAAIECAKRAVERFGLDQAPKDSEKVRLVGYLRDHLDDDAVAWLDAVLVVGHDELGFPPVLGTGGTEGALDFASNFYQRLHDLFGFSTGAPAPRSEALLHGALFGSAVDGLANAAIGQFDPLSAGGGNAAPGFDGKSLVNPWDFVLLIEGTLLLASATTKKLDSAAPGALVYPFSVRSVGAGYASSDPADERGTRNELWLPLWESPTRCSELARLFGEGRAEVRRKRAVHAVDFARAVGSLGVDRGISGFTRFGFHKRNGKSYFATPLGRWRVRRNPSLDLVDATLAGWIDRLRRAARGKYAPASWRRTANRVETAVLALAAEGSHATVQELMVALATAERVFSGSRSGPESLSAPVPALDSTWLRRADDGTAAHALAVALATTAIRERLTRARWVRGRARWATAEDHRTAWRAGMPLLTGLGAIIRREEIEDDRDATPDALRLIAPPSSALRCFLDGRTDDARLEALIRAYALVAPHRVPPPRSQSPANTLPAAFALCALAHHRLVPGTDGPVHRTVGVTRALIAGDVSRATRLAARRLRALGVRLAVDEVCAPPSAGPRIAAALAFPMSDGLARLALSSICMPMDEQDATTSARENPTPVIAPEVS